MAAGWEVGYEIYFTFEGGETVCVTVSENGDAWTTGQGDFNTQGDFVDFFKRLQ